MPGGIFISYRRDDSAPWAGRLYERLARDFPRQQLFMDVDAIEPGLDFVKVLDDHVSGCDVLLAIIGRDWVDAKNVSGVRRLDDPDDFVRIELGSALKRDIRVVPVLVDGATMPRSDQLPEDLKPLVRRNAVQISHARFGSDTQGLIEVLQRLVTRPAAKRAGFLGFFSHSSSAAVAARPVPPKSGPDVRTQPPQAAPQQKKTAAQTEPDVDTLAVPSRRGIEASGVMAACIWLAVCSIFVFLMGAKSYEYVLFGQSRHYSAFVGFMIGAALAILSGRIVVWRRGDSLGGAESAIYWLGSMTAFLALFCSAVLAIGELGFWPSTSAAYIALGAAASTIAIVSALVRQRRRHAPTSAEVTIHWVFVAVSVAAAICAVFVKLELNFFNVRHSDEELISGLIASSIFAAASGNFARKVWRRQQGLPRTGFDIALWLLLAATIALSALLYINKEPVPMPAPAAMHDPNDASHGESRET